MSNWGGGSGFYSGAARDKWPYIQSLHSDFYTPPGEITTINTARINDPEVDRLIDEIGALPPDDPENYELTLEFFKYYVEEMFAIPMVGFTKFITTDTGVYWENFPKSDDPYYQPNFWFIGGKFFLPFLEQVQ
jgi:peptide/nickel transport system substrate-binding protein